MAFDVATKIFNRIISAVGFEDTYGNKVYPVVKSGATVNTKTSDYTILQSELNQVFDNAGDNGTTVLTLPAVRDSYGKALKVHVLAAQIIRCLPQTGEAVDLHGSAVVTKYLDIAGVIGNYVDLYCDGSKWIVTHSNGVVTKEA